MTTLRGTWGTPGEVFGQLAGHWTLDRDIEGEATFDGTASFSPHDSALRYLETGWMRLRGGTVFAARRGYLFGALAAGFEVRFDDAGAALFHRIELVEVAGLLLGEAVHLCGEDRYRSRYAFAADGGFTVRHIVTGPRKDYTIRSRFRRSD